MASGCACHAGPPHAPPVATRDQGASPAKDACGRPLNGVEPCKEELLLRARSRVDGEKREDQHDRDNPSEGMESDEHEAVERGGDDDADQGSEPADSPVDPTELPRMSPRAVGRAMGPVDAGEPRSDRGSRQRDGEREGEPGTEGGERREQEQAVRQALGGLGLQ